MPHPRASRPAIAMRPRRRLLAAGGAPRRERARAPPPPPPPAQHPALPCCPSQAQRRSCEAQQLEAAFSSGEGDGGWGGDGWGGAPRGDCASPPLEWAAASSSSSSTSTSNNTSSQPLRGTTRRRATAANASSDGVGGRGSSSSRSSDDGGDPVRPLGTSPDQERQRAEQQGPQQEQAEQEQGRESLGVRAALAALRFYREGMSPLMQSTCRWGLGAAAAAGSGAVKMERAAGRPSRLPAPARWAVGHRSATASGRFSPTHPHPVPQVCPHLLPVQHRLVPPLRRGKGHGADGVAADALQPLGCGASGPGSRARVAARWLRAVQSLVQASCCLPVGARLPSQAAPPPPTATAPFPCPSPWQAAPATTPPAGRPSAWAPSSACRSAPRSRWSLALPRWCASATHCCSSEAAALRGWQAAAARACLRAQGGNPMTPPEATPPSNIVVTPAAAPAVEGVESRTDAKVMTRGRQVMTEEARARGPLGSGRTGARRQAAPERAWGLGSGPARTGGPGGGSGCGAVLQERRRPRGRRAGRQCHPRPPSRGATGNEWV
jgi:hypothetical protein